MITTLLLVLTIGFPSARAAEHSQDSTTTIKANLDKGTAILVDVREVEEWNEGHLKVAMLYQLSDINDMPSPKELKQKFGDKKIVYLHCRSGGRCLLAAAVLKEKGYDIRPLKQGYRELLKAGFEPAE